MMTGFVNWIKRSPLVAYFFLTFAVEWLLFILLSTFTPPVIALMIGAWLPNGVGVLVTGVADGRDGLRELFRKVVLWRIGRKWFAVALFAPMAMAFLAIGLYALSGNTVPDFAPTSQLLPILLLAIFTGAMGEELGWRGTALPRLQARWNALTSSLILSLLWGLYHLPSFLMSGLPLKDVPFIPFMLAVFGITILVTWIFNYTGGSLIPVFLFHFAFNFIGNVTGIFGDPVLFGLFAGIISLIALAVVAFQWTHFKLPVTVTTNKVYLWSIDPPPGK